MPSSISSCVHTVLTESGLGPYAEQNEHYHRLLQNPDFAHAAASTRRHALKKVARSSMSSKDAKGSSSRDSGRESRESRGSAEAEDAGEGDGKDGAGDGSGNGNGNGEGAAGSEQQQVEQLEMWLLDGDPVEVSVLGVVTRVVRHKLVAFGGESAETAVWSYDVCAENAKSLGVSPGSPVSADPALAGGKVAARVSAGQLCEPV